jgi:hypothetical protein
VDSLHTADAESLTEATGDDVSLAALFVGAVGVSIRVIRSSVPGGLKRNAVLLSGG